MRKIKQLRWDWWLVAILTLAAFLYGWNIWEAGSANSYYTAAVTSMVQSWHNFWYGAFDPAGFITVDKPPVALWFMAISAKIFGVQGWAIVLPSVLFGIGSVGLIYAMVRPTFGAWPARFAALIMTLTPIVVADSRTNNMDATLVFFLLLAGYCLMQAVAKKRNWLALMSFALIGVAFNVKMLQAFMILPAMYCFYWIASKQSWRKKVATLLAASLTAAAFTLAYPLSVDSTDSSKRPYIGSSQTNSLLELAFGYNGTERLLGQSTGTGAAFPGMGKSNESGTAAGMTPPGGSEAQAPNGQTKSASGKQSKSGQSNQAGGTPPTGQQAPSGKQGTPPAKPSGTQPQGQQPANGQKAANGKTSTGTKSGSNGAPAIPSGGQGEAPGGQMGGGPGGKGGKQSGGMNSAFAIGTAGPLRLVQSDLGPQISWLLPLALIGTISSFVYYIDRKRRWYQLSAQQQHLVFWMGWLVPVAGFFSIAGFFHPYYMIMLAPPIAALAGIGIVTLMRQFRGSLKRWTTWLFPLAFILTMGLQVWYVSLVYSNYLPIALGAVAILALAALLFLRHKPRTIGMAVALVTLLLAPGWWSLTPTLAGESAAIPYASPTLLTQGSQAGGLGKESVDQGLLSYLEKNQGSATYLFVTSDANSASPYIIASGKAVMATGGYNGTDPAITLKQFKQLVKTGQVKYYLSSGRAGSSAIAKWVAQVGKTVDSSQYSSQSTSKSTSKTTATNQPGGQGNQPGGMGAGSGTLYQLSPSMVK